MNHYNVQTAEFLIRAFTGIVFLFQGYDKLFRIKMPGVIETFKADADRFHIPHPLLTVVAYYTSIVEFVGGIMLLFGFFTSLSLYALGLDLIVVSFAFSYMKPMWDMRHVFPRFILIITLLMIPPHNRLISLDYLFNLR